MTISEFILNKTVTRVILATEYNIITGLFIDNIEYCIDVDKSSLPNIYASQITTNFTIIDNILSANGITLDLTVINIIGVKWLYARYPKRIIAPNTLVFDNSGSKLFNWFKLINLPIVRIGDFSYIYCNEIRPEHQDFVLSFGSLITIEDRP